MSNNKRRRMLIDLDKLCSVLPREHGKIARAARKWRQAHSFSADLLLAHDDLTEAIRWHSTGRKALSRAKTALLHNAILSYFRPFDNASKHRGQLQIYGKLSPEQLEFHNQIINLRHESLAHYGPAGTDKAWSEDRMFILLEGDTWMPVATARRSQFESRFARDFLSHVTAIQTMVRDSVESFRADLQRQLQTAWENFPEFDSMIISSEAEASVLGGWDGPLLGGNRTGRQVMELPDMIFQLR